MAVPVVGIVTSLSVFFKIPSIKTFDFLLTTSFKNQFKRYTHHAFYSKNGKQCYKLIVLDSLATSPFLIYYPFKNAAMKNYILTDNLYSLTTFLY